MTVVPSYRGQLDSNPSSFWNVNLSTTDFVVSFPGNLDAGGAVVSRPAGIQPHFPFSNINLGTSHVVDSSWGNLDDGGDVVSRPVGIQPHFSFSNINLGTSHSVDFSRGNLDDGGAVVARPAGVYSQLICLGASVGFSGGDASSDPGLTRRHNISMECDDTPSTEEAAGDFTKLLERSQLQHMIAQCYRVG